MPWPWLPPRGKPEKRAVFSPHCGDETTTSYNRAFLKHDRHTVFSLLSRLADPTIMGFWGCHLELQHEAVPQKRLMFSFLKSNGITQNPPAIEPIGRKAENWIKSILVVLYCGDNTARYLLQSQKNSIVCCCTAFRKRCESKDAVLRGAPLG